MIRILGLQGTHQQFKLGQPMQVLETVVFQEERPAGEPVADASLQPGKGIFALSRQSQNTSDLILGVVRVAK